MSFNAKKIHFLVHHSFISQHFGYSKLCLGSRVSSRHRIFQPIKKTVVRKATWKPQQGFLLLSGQVLQFVCEQRLLFTVKRNCSVFLHDFREREWIFTRVKFFPFICHIKHWSMAEIVTCILLTSNQMIFLMQFGITMYS